MRSLIIDLHEQLKAGKVTPQQLADNAKALWEKNKDLNTVITPVFKVTNSKFDPNNLLSCIPYSLKDNVSTKGILTTGGSKFLSNYVPPFSATCYELLQQSGANLMCKDSMDEFGLGGTGTYCFTGLVKNPNDPTKITGGSSSGSVSNVKLGISAFALGTDTGDSIRRPASLVGVVGYKPTYGAISRYGVLPYAPSMDHVGIIANYVADVCIVASQLIKQDDKDQTSTNLINDVKLENLKTKTRIKFVVYSSLLERCEKEYREAFLKLIEKIKAHGHQVIIYDYPLSNFNEIIKAYRIITYMEGYSCYSNLTGITFGNDLSNDKDSYEATLTKNRTEGLGWETKRRFVLGAYLTRHDMFEKNMRDSRELRKLICTWTNEVYQNVGDCVIMPTVHGKTPGFDYPFCPSGYSDWLMSSNFAGTPSITVPFTKINGMPYGCTLSMNLYKDMELLRAAYTVEEIIHEGGDHE